jgi:alpha-beta hydrolase superfamily lysophospholipase
MIAQESVRKHVWLHGFASSPASSKGRYVRSRLAEKGVWLSLPDLNQPSFRGLTVTRGLQQLDALAAEPPLGAEGRPAELVLFGSSLGGYTAAAWAAQPSSRCAALVLLAPAFALGQRWTDRMRPEDVARWRSEGALPFDHYAWGRKELLGREFLEDAERREEYPLPTAPTLVLQGLRDDVVEPGLAREFTRRMEAAGRAVKLVELDEGHELNQDLPALWGHIEAFLAPWLPAPRR